MQVQIETKPKVYEPKTLKITFETEEEYLIFLDMVGFDISIPGLVYPSEQEQQAKLMGILLKIQEAM